METLLQSAISDWVLRVEQTTDCKWFARVDFKEPKLDDDFRCHYAPYGPSSYHKKIDKAIRGAMDYHAAYVADIATAVAKQRFSQTTKMIFGSENT